jgi:hypothetical protein
MDARQFRRGYFFPASFAPLPCSAATLIDLVRSQWDKFK